jgi:hypothetical protein
MEEGGARMGLERHVDKGDADQGEAGFGRHHAPHYWMSDI